MADKQKRIPNNSITIIMKLKSKSALEKLLKDPKFQQAQGKLENIALEKGAEWKSFTNP